MKTNCDIEETIKVTIDEIITASAVNGLDSFLDFIAEKAGHPLLTDINYEAIGVGIDGKVHIRVKGCVEMEEQDGEEQSPTA